MVGRLTIGPKAIMRRTAIASTRALHRGRHWPMMALVRTVAVGPIGVDD